VFDLASHLMRLQEEARLWELASLLFLLGIYGLLLYIRHAAELREAEEETHRIAYTDSLTGLPNRRQFIETLSCVWCALKGDEKCAVLILDLDQFKPLNDLYGHRIGDEVLRATAFRLKEIVSDRTLVARMGGDEFGIMMPTVVDGDAPRRIAQRIVEEIPKPIHLAALSLDVAVSVGITIVGCAEEVNPLAAQDGSFVETILRQADMALYLAKTEAQGSYQTFRPEMDDELQQRMELEREIGRAIETGQIVPYYQPMIDLKSGGVIGFEVLARWQHPKRGLLLPAIIIPIAKATGVISEMTYALIHQVLEDTLTWPGALTVSINLLPGMLTNTGLAEEISDILAKHSFPAHRLQFEITESTLLNPTVQVKATLESLRLLGIRTAIDDFGAGYSGFSYLHEFKVDGIKIDRSFVTGMLTNSSDEKIVEAILSFGRALGLETTAEGIESLAVRNRLLELGCDNGQGYYFEKPKPNSEILCDLISRSMRISA
jgi:diguanylate cyclase (GGDEF)-like protein